MKAHLRVVKDSESASSGSPISHALAIPMNEIEEVRWIVEPWLAEAARYTEKETAASYLDLCEKGYAQLWVVWDEPTDEAYGVCVTDIQIHVLGRRTARIIALGGREFSRWKHLMTEIEEWANAHDCKTLEIVGRKGWGRVFPDFKPIEWVFSKEL